MIFTKYLFLDFHFFFFINRYSWQNIIIISNFCPSQGRQGKPWMPLPCSSFLFLFLLFLLHVQLWTKRSIGFPSFKAKARLAIMLHHLQTLRSIRLCRSFTQLCNQGLIGCTIGLMGNKGVNHRAFWDRKATQTHIFMLWLTRVLFFPSTHTNFSHIPFITYTFMQLVETYIAKYMYVRTNTYKQNDIWHKVYVFRVW